MTDRSHVVRFKEICTILGQSAGLENAAACRVQSATSSNLFKACKLSVNVHARVQLRPCGRPKDTITVHAVRVCLPKICFWNFQVNQWDGLLVTDAVLQVELHQRQHLCTHGNTLDSVTCVPLNANCLWVTDHKMTRSRWRAACSWCTHSPGCSGGGCGWSSDNTSCSRWGPAETYYAQLHNQTWPKHTFHTNLIVLERFGANGEAAKLYGLLVARWNIQVPELLTAIPGEFERPQLSALLGKYV